MSDNSRNSHDLGGSFKKKIGESFNVMINRLNGVGEVGDKKGIPGTSVSKTQADSEFPHGTRNPTKYGLSGTKVNDVVIYVTDIDNESFLYEDVFTDSSLKPEEYSKPAETPQGNRKMFDTKAPEKVPFSSGKTAKPSRNITVDELKEYMAYAAPRYGAPLIKESVDDDRSDVEEVGRYIVEVGDVALPAEDVGVNPVLDDPAINVVSDEDAHDTPVVEIPSRREEVVPEALVKKTEPVLSVEYINIIPKSVAKETKQVIEVPVEERVEEIVLKTPVVAPEDVADVAEAPVAEMGDVVPEIPVIALEDVAEIPVEADAPVAEIPVEAEAPVAEMGDVVPEIPVIALEDVAEEADAPVAEIPVEAEAPVAEMGDVVPAEAPVEDVVLLAPVDTEAVIRLPPATIVNRIAAPESVPESQVTEIEFIDGPILEVESPVEEPASEEMVVIPSVPQVPVMEGTHLEGSAVGSMALSTDKKFETEESNQVPTSGAAVFRPVETGLPSFGESKSSSRPVRGVTASTVPKGESRGVRPIMSAKALRRSASIHTAKTVEKKDSAIPAVKVTRDRRATYVEVPVQTSSVRPMVRPRTAVTDAEIEKAREKMSKLVNPTKASLASKSDSSRPVERLRIGADSSRARPSVRSQSSKGVRKESAIEATASEVEEVMSVSEEPVVAFKTSHVTFAFGETTTESDSTVNFLF